MATLPSVRNLHEVERHLLELVRQRALALGYENLSTLIEEDARAAAPPWLARGRVLKSIDNYLRSGVRFVYVQAKLSDAGSVPAGAAATAGAAEAKGGAA
jgi:hypothetical protein